MKTVELYRRVESKATKEEEEKESLKNTNKTLELVTKYQMPNVRCLDMTTMSIKSALSLFKQKKSA